MASFAGGIGVGQRTGVQTGNLRLTSVWRHLTPEFSCEGAGLELWMLLERCAPSSAATIR